MKCDNYQDKDYLIWKTINYTLSTDHFAHNKYIEHLETEERLKEHGVNQVKKCPECEKENKTNKIVMPEDKFVEYYCEACIKALEEKEADELKAKEEKQLIEDGIKAKEQAVQDQIERQNKYINSVPPRYQNLEESSNKQLIDATCAILFGGFGTGKTWAAYSLIKKLYLSLKIKSYEMITEAGLINHLKAGFNNNSFEDRLNKYKDADLLIVDEMGKSNDTDFNKSQLFEILNYRYDWMKKTVLICNCLERSELVDILNPAIADRYRECIIHMDGKSKRYEENQV